MLPADDFVPALPVVMMICVLSVVKIGQNFGMIRLFRLTTFSFLFFRDVIDNHRPWNVFATGLEQFFLDLDFFLSYLESFRMEQALHDAISDYLVKEVGTHYLQGEFCVPQMMIAYADVAEQVDSAQVWGDFWVFWYQLSGDTLKTVSGGNHSGCMTIKKKEGKPVVTAFEQTVDGAGNEASAKRIFGSHYDAYQCIHSDAAVRELVRREQLRDFVRRNGMSARCYQDYGWPAVEL